MLPLLLALLSPAVASDIVVTLDRPVMVYIDGKRLPMDVGSLSTQARGLGSGTHLVEIRNMMGRAVTGLTVNLGEDEELRLRYQGKQLSELGRGGLPPAAAAPAAPAVPAQDAPTAQPAMPAPPPSPEELAAGFGLTTTTTTATAPSSTTETASVSASTPAGGLSMSVTVTESGTGSTAAAPPAAASSLSSASFVGPDPVMFSITMDGRTVPYVAGAGAFIAPDLAPGKHAFVMYMQGSEALRADFSTERGVHSACTILVQPFGYDTSCVPGGTPVTATSLQQGAAVAGTAAGTAAGTTAGININVFTSGSTTAASAAPVGPQPISDSGLVALIAAVEDATFGSDQVSVLQTAASSNHFSCAQVVRLLEPLDHSSDKVAGVQALRGAILDPQNAYLLEQAFTFSSDKEEVRAMFR